jgi:selenide,water dikinase
MTDSNRAAAAILRRHGVHAATDVTGFGLLGHLVEMVRASGVDVTLRVAAVPLLEGARETLERGIFSSLQPQNVRLRRAIRNLDEAAGHPLYPMLFDPQTAGGLLASVPGEAADACLAALRAAGYGQAAIVGAVEASSDALEPVTLDLSPEPSAPAPAGRPALARVATNSRQGSRSMPSNPFSDAFSS